MSNNINKFYEALKADEGLKSRFNELRAKNENSDEAMTLIADFAASEGFPFTAEEFAASIKSMQRELDDSELEAVDGGIAIAGEGDYHNDNIYDFEPIDTTRPIRKKRVISADGDIWDYCINRIL